jgi:hypothetical protein
MACYPRIERKAMSEEESEHREIVIDHDAIVKRGAVTDFALEALHQGAKGAEFWAGGAAAKHLWESFKGSPPAPPAEPPKSDGRSEAIQKE